MNQTTNHKIFNEVKEHLIKQNARAVDAAGITCTYRSSKGLKCAVGALILDKLYDKEMEGMTIDQNPQVKDVVFKSLIEKGYAITKEEYEGDVMSMLGQLQYIHDRHDIPNWQFEINKLENQLFNTVEV